MSGPNLSQCTKCGEWAWDDEACACQANSELAPARGYAPPRSPIEAMIDAATGYAAPEPTGPTKEQKAEAEIFANDVMSDLKYYYPEVLKTRPTTWPKHLRNTIAAKAARMLAAHNAGTQRPGSPDGSLATETRKPGSLK